VADKIGGLDNRPVQVGRESAVQRPKDSAAGAIGPQGSAPSEAVHITGSARQLATLEQQLKDSPAIDAARVAKVRETIDSGQYQVNGARVAAKLLSLEQQLATHLGGGK
jgi:negative regulator of flagellin synthesis FlgM